ncbi:MAG: exo-alpha-sialidase [Candidatus Hydrogenedentes bacterium]|nr:exo-alpha-sialidase [Candidatus Hydrogenedentota bacterium]
MKFMISKPYFPASHYATLAYMRKRPGEPWSSPKVLIVSPFSEYGVFYHRLTIDPQGRLFLSYDCWSTYWFYRNDHHGTRRALMMSPDGGDTWKLAAMEDIK